MNKLDITKVTEELTPLISKGMSSYDIAKHLNLAPTTIRHRLKICNLKTKPYLKTNVQGIKFKCLHCEVEIQYPKTHFCSKKHKVAYYAKNLSPEHHKAQRLKGRKIRMQLIDKEGGKCIFCSYDKNYSCLVFHHKNPNEKLFNIDTRRCANSSLEKLEKEVAKCILLCANCHTALHNPLQER